MRKFDARRFNNYPLPAADTKPSEKQLKRRFFIFMQLFSSRKKVYNKNFVGFCCMKTIKLNVGSISSRKSFNDVYRLI